jgi:hypothetical protein
MESSIKFPERDVSYTKGVYVDNKIKYNIPVEQGKQTKKKAGKIPKQKYNPKNYARINNTLFEGVNIMAMAKYLFTDVHTTRYLIDCLEKGEDGEYALHKALKFEHKRIMMEDKKNYDKNMLFSDDDITYLKVIGLNPNSEELKQNKIIRDLIDENGNVRSDKLDNLIKLLV